MVACGEDVRLEVGLNDGHPRTDGDNLEVREGREEQAAGWLEVKEAGRRRWVIDLAKGIGSCVLCRWIIGSGGTSGGDVGG